MSTHSQGSGANNNKNIPFMFFWQFIATQLGSARLRINPNAKSIREFIDISSDHKEYLREAIRQSYKRSRCHHLGAPINIDCVLDILGETAYQLQGQQCDDLLDIELLEEIAWCINERFSANITLQNEDKKPQPTQVISFPNAKIRRANSRL